MPFNQFNIGRDFVLDIATQLGVQSFVIATEFTSKQRTDSVKSKGMDGVTRFAELPDGWEGTLTFDRASVDIDAFFSQLEQNYYKGVPILASTITETVNETDGSISQWLYYGVTLMYDDAGTKKGDDKVSQKVAFKASGRRQLV